MPRTMMLLASAATLALTLVSPASAQLLQHKDLSLSIALAIANGALDACKAMGYATSVVVVDRDGEILGRYRKVHLPGSVEPRAGAAYQQLEKRYFEYGDLGFPAFRAGPDWRHAIMGMMICNDRRWPESWRVLGLQGVELVCIGYNSAAYDPNGGVTEDVALRTFHSKLVTQANAYMNATWAIAVAKAGNEDGSGLIGGSCIVDPNGRIVAETQTLADEVVVADLDLDLCRQGKDKMFNFAAHRRPEQYTVITERAGVIEPTALDAIQYHAGTRSAGRRS